MNTSAVAEAGMASRSRSPRNGRAFSGCGTGGVWTQAKSRTREHGGARADGEERREAEALHQRETQRRRAGRGERGGEAEHAHALGKAGLRDDIRRDGGGGGVGKREGRAVEHARDEGEKQHAQREIADRHERHAGKADEQNGLALSGIEHPADDRAAEDRDDGKERGGETRRRLRPAEMLHIERERGEDHQMVEKDEKVDDDDEDEVLAPEA